MPRGRPRKIDPQDALKSALHTLWEQGYDRTSMADLVKATGMAKPGLYANLGDKDEIFQKALELYQDEMGTPMIEALVHSDEALKDSLRAALRGVVHAKEGSGLPEGCFIINSTINCAAQPDHIQDKMRAMNMARRDAFLQRLERAQTDQELPEGTDIVALANFFAGQSASIFTMSQAGLPLEDLEAMIEVSLSVLPDASD
ncbi:TetR/AcrR family transcriptional regulator [Labrenzia sp. PHM005]|uniref:TetR/AcrR family transcriptional regulator n=1 Tax=Labrenzia sp. PHM005 TaxID=2590016 RepID=UPI001140204E|nr:TetR/AcrR family transcriptional regulator [Labrenzia sp. PHM005]QDG75820.1 TetR/AcrR family transcriptional regulator [Labrenzia sp. PHM005]